MEPEEPPPPSLRRALVMGLLSVVIVIVWWVTDYPWNGFLPYALINAALAAMLVVRVIRWPGFLWLVFLAWFLSSRNVPRA